MSDFTKNLEVSRLIFAGCIHDATALIKELTTKELHASIKRCTFLINDTKFSSMVTVNHMAGLAVKKKLAEDTLATRNIT